MPGGADGEDEAARGFGFTVGVLVTLFLAAVIPGLFGAATDRAQASSFLWPTTWRFYTDSAHREFVVVYRLGDDADIAGPLTHPVAHPAHRWGFGHTAYAEFARLIAVAGAVPPEAWRPCAGALMADCSAAVAAAPRTTVVTRPGFVTGPVVLAVERPARWSDGLSRRVVRIAVLDLVHPG